jgi:iron complex outermembrane receptor protein
MTIGYRLPETAWGKFSFTWDTTYLAQNEFDLDGDGIFNERITDVPGIGQPTETWSIEEAANAPGLYVQQLQQLAHPFEPLHALGDE